MKIAFFVNQFPSLSETFILNQITGLIDRGHEVDIYADRPDDSKKQHPDVDKYHLLERTCYIGRPNNYFWRIFKLFKLPLANFINKPAVFFKSLNVVKYGGEAKSLRLLYAASYLLGRESQYDVIHAHFGPNGQKGIFLRELDLIKGKIITTFHGYDISQYIQAHSDNIYEQLFAQGDIFSSISRDIKCKLINLGCDEKKIIIHRVGIDCSKFLFTPRQPPNDGTFKILTIARLVEKKGVDYGIRAIANLIKSGINIQYNIVGNGLLIKELQKLIHKLNVSNHVKILGWKEQPEVIELLNNSHIFLAPSITSRDGDQEGIPTVIMEAMAMGLPVISTYHSGIPELVENGVSGFLVPERDVDNLTEKLGYLLANPDLWSNMGLAGRAFVEEHYDINKLNDRLVEIYQSLTQIDKNNKTHLTASTQI